MSDWYEKFIEIEVRQLVYLLRNNGFNTSCSCGHELEIEMESYGDSDMTNLYNLLLENNYFNFRITRIWETYPLQRTYIVLKLLKK